MVCAVQIYDKPRLNKPILIEGLPGIGFVANIAALHLINELEAKLLAEVSSSSFQDLAVATENGGVYSPVNQLYYYRRTDGGNDLIIWYGNTQALTTFGQYELCGCILDLVEELGCQYIVTLGGFKQEQNPEKPEIYCAGSHLETIKTALDLGTKTMVGQIFGLAGITIGLGKLRNLKGFSLLVETAGTHPDGKAAHEALKALCKFLDLRIDLSRVDVTTKKTERILQSFGLIAHGKQEKKKEEESEFRWFV